MIIREGRADEAHLLALCFRRMWLDLGVKPSGLVEDWRERVETFVEHGRRELDLRFFLAEVADEPPRVVGSACAQRLAGLYPDLLRPSVRRYGYVWGVWVDPGHRRAGLGRALTERAVRALEAEGYSHAVLHATRSGRSVYERLGFEPTNELRLRLSEE